MLESHSRIEYCDDDDDDVNVNKTCQYVIRKDQPPGVINNEMLNRVIREAQGPSQEEIRLCRDIPIVYSSITDLRLEFLNILKIDHLWMLTNLQRLSLKCNKVDKIENLDNLINLRELDLSFNSIEHIENLDCLVQLERLSLFRNNIRRIEKLQRLEKMIRLSIGNNLIDTTDGITSLFSMKKLYSLNLDGNPIVDNLDGNVDFRLYIASHLPHLKYYDYSMITEAEREKGREIFKSELRVLDEKRNETFAQRDLEDSEAGTTAYLTNCFIENLYENRLFDQMFGNDKHKRKLQTFKEKIEIDHLVEQYRVGIVQQTEKICKCCEANYNIRFQEIKDYEESIDGSRNVAQLEGVKLIDFFNKEKMNVVEEAKSRYQTLADAAEHNANSMQQMMQSVNESLQQKFETLIDKVWYALIERETTLHERIEEMREYFSSNITTIVKEFIASVQKLFPAVRIACEEYFKMIDEKIRASKISDDQLENLCATDRAQHLAVIERRQSDVVSNAEKWLSTNLEKYKNAENECNRLRILEINNFLDAQRNMFNQMLNGLAEEWDLID